MLMMHHLVFSLYKSCFFWCPFFLSLTICLARISIINSHPAFHSHEIVNTSHRFPVCGNMATTFPYFCVGNVNKIACILIGEAPGTKAERVPCTVLCSHHSAPVQGEDTAKSAPSCKEEIASVLLKDSPQRAEESKCRKPEKLTTTENLKHRQIKRPCPKPVQEIASEMNIQTSDDQTQDFFFFLIWCTGKYKPFPYHQKFHKAGPLMTILRYTFLRT